MTDKWLSLSVIFATLLGPVLAVIVARIQESAVKRHDRQAATFRTLMATRSAAVSPEHVGAINTIEVDFHGVKAVETAWQDYVSHLNSLGPNPSVEERTRFEESRRDKLAILLGKMSAALGITKSEIEIRRGGYAPEGWANQQARKVAAENWVLDLASGQRALPIRLINSDKADPPVHKPPSA